MCVCLQVGLAACQLSRSQGLRVLGTAGTAEGMNHVRNNGAHMTFNHREGGYTDKIMVCTHTPTHTRHTCQTCPQPYPQYDCVNTMCVCFSVFQEATTGRGVDVIVEMLSNVNLSRDLQMLAHRGRVVVSSIARLSPVAQNLNSVALCLLCCS